MAAPAVKAEGGLSTAEAKSRQLRFGENRLRERQKISVLRLVAKQFANLMILVLMVAAVISGVFGDFEETLVILLIVVLNAVIGFVQEYRAEQAISALNAMAAPLAHVLRDGHWVTIPSLELVPGDVVTLTAGDKISADLRLVEAVQLKVDESTLTGESVAIDKTIQVLAYQGTLVTYGRGIGVVTSIGMETELGKIAALLNDQEEMQTPLQKRLTQLGRRLSLGALAICGIVFFAGVLRGEKLFPLFMTALSLAVAAIPEALPAVVTISLALGAARMTRRKALIRRLPAVETLGSITYICSDKTGTLTENKMSVEEVFCDGRLLKVPFSESL
ncbi:HAD-IC family P-type ATPase [Bdellovibrionota bacterium FG-1]